MAPWLTVAATVSMIATQARNGHENGGIEAPKLRHTTGDSSAAVTTVTATAVRACLPA